MSVPKTHFHPSKGQKNSRSVDLFLVLRIEKTDFLFSGDGRQAHRAALSSPWQANRYAALGLDNRCSADGLKALHQKKGRLCA